tara:strand:- start:232 stop:531 length:300 start_codon:yes stop_codon:yes gene_type:complete
MPLPETPKANPKTEVDGAGPHHSRTRGKNRASSGLPNRPALFSKFDVQWDGDNQFYPAKIDEILGDQATSTKARILYDDGETEVIDFNTHKWKLTGVRR